MLIDAHAHLDQYGDDLSAALGEIRRDEIVTISTATDLPSYRKGIEIAAQCAFVVPTFGVHPWCAPQYAALLPTLGRAIEQSPMIGEIGLDFHWVEDRSCYPAQMKVLEFFLAAAREQRKVVNLHTKGAEAEILRLLERYHITRAVIHWYSGPLDVFRALISHGCYFTIGVEVLSSAHIRTLTQALPLSRVLTETDNPGGAKWLTGVVGMPSLLHDVVGAIATLKGMTPGEVSEAVRENFFRLVEHDPWWTEVRR
jgi:TatD DNase family protein